MTIIIILSIIWVLLRIPKGIITGKVHVIGPENYYTIVYNYNNASYTATVPEDVYTNYEIGDTVCLKYIETESILGIQYRFDIL